MYPQLTEIVLMVMLLILPVQSPHGLFVAHELLGPHRRVVETRDATHNMIACIQCQKKCDSLLRLLAHPHVQDVPDECDVDD